MRSCGAVRRGAPRRLHTNPPSNIYTRSHRTNTVAVNIILFPGNGYWYFLYTYYTDLAIYSEADLIKMILTPPSPPTPPPPTENFVAKVALTTFALPLKRQKNTHTRARHRHRPSQQQLLAFVNNRMRSLWLCILLPTVNVTVTVTVAVKKFTSTCNQLFKYPIRNGFP